MERFCKACLVKYEDPSELLHYTEKNRRLFVYATGLQVKPNDVLPFQICQACFLKMKMACQFRKQCRTSDKRLNNFLSLREAGEDTDFTTYLQNNDGSVLFKFPLNGHNTPSFQKAKEDDNMSTSTSIRNFMTDFLREDEVPDTEAHIIREMIEQEADVLDDSLDSEWLQDDISIASDFRYAPPSLDPPKTKINRFSPYSTPLSKHNYQPLLNYTPIKEEPSDQEQSGGRNVLAAKKLLLNSKSCSSSQTESPRSLQENTDHKTFIAAKKILLNAKSSSSGSQAESIIKLESNTDHVSYIAKKKALLKSNSNKIATELALSQGKDMETYLATKSILLSSKSNSSDNEIEEPTNIKNISTQKISVKKIYNELEENNTNQNILTARKGFYIEANENTIKIDDIYDVGSKKDNIDKNLENLLNNTDDDIISLSALLASPSSETAPPCNGVIATPRVHQGLSGANTPTIANILFGEKLDDEQRSEEPKPDNDNIETDKADEADILEDFFNKATGKYIGENEEDQDEIFEEYTNPKIDGFVPGKSQFDLTDFSCKKCNVRYKSERGLKIHFAKAHKYKIICQRKKEPRVELPCDQCGKIFSLKSNLSKHIKVMHLAPKKAQTCKVCSLEFSTEARLKLHMKSHGVIHKSQRDHKNKLSLVCPICGHMSTQVSNLKTHIARHNKEYAFKCDPCGHGFYRKSDLQIHMRIHMNEKPFQCPQCSESFRRKDQLQIHLKRHAGERPYICEICSKRFATSAKLKNHMKNSKTCQDIKINKALKANKAIEESIEQLYVTETLVKLSNEKILAGMGGKIISSIDTKVTAPSNIGDSDDSFKLEDVIEDQILHPAKEEQMVQDIENADKISLSDMFTIPIVIK